MIQLIELRGLANRGYLLFDDTWTREEAKAESEELVEEYVDTRGPDDPDWEVFDFNEFVQNQDIVGVDHIGIGREVVEFPSPEVVEQTPNESESQNQECKGGDKQG